jgi:hypothetical protein
MEPSAYYYGPFRDHLASFWRSLNERGSVSRVRLRLTPTRFAAQSATHFSVVDLVARPDHGLPDHLVSVPSEMHLDFLCALLYTILIDQVMYSHRHGDYPEFQAMTLYPKMDRTVGYSRTLMMANPYEVFENNILTNRGLRPEEVTERFSVWAEFIASDLCAFFTQHQVGTTTWTDVKAAMLQDPGATWGIAGAILANALASDHNAI